MRNAMNIVTTLIAMKNRKLRTQVTINFRNVFMEI